MKRIIAALTAAVALLVGACSSGGYGTVGPPDLSSGNGAGSGGPPANTSSTALFEPAAGILPYPTDLYFAGSTDGTINIQPPNAAMPNQAAINGLDGFSTTAVIRENFGWRAGPDFLHGKLGDHRAGGHRQHNQGDHRRARAAADPGR